MDETKSYNVEDFDDKNVERVLEDVYYALEERGYNAVHQIAGYLISNDPAYISSHKGARSIIQQIDRDEIIEELVKFYLEKK